MSDYFRIGLSGMAGSSFYSSLMPRHHATADRPSSRRSHGGLFVVAVVLGGVGHLATRVWRPQTPMAHAASPGGREAAERHKPEMGACLDKGKRRAL